jgi:hypothetical protein
MDIRGEHNLPPPFRLYRSAMHLPAYPYEKKRVSRLHDIIEIEILVEDVSTRNRENKRHVVNASTSIRTPCNRGSRITFGKFRDDDEARPSIE